MMSIRFEFFTPEFSVALSMVFSNENLRNKHCFITDLLQSSKGVTKFQNTKYRELCIKSCVADTH